MCDVFDANMFEILPAWLKHVFKKAKMSWTLSDCRISTRCLRKGDRFLPCHDGLHCHIRDIQSALGAKVIVFLALASPWSKTSESSENPEHAILIYLYIYYISRLIIKYYK